jgi:hypothetical protein
MREYTIEYTIVGRNRDEIPTYSCSGNSYNEAVNRGLKEIQELENERYGKRVTVVFRSCNLWKK